MSVHVEIRCEECDGTGAICVRFSYGLVQLECATCEGKGYVIA
jgi:DnaJ-class molecular chaperone